MTIKLIRLSEVAEGMVLARTLSNDKGMLLCAEGTALTPTLIARFERMGIDSIYVHSQEKMTAEEYEAKKSDVLRRFERIEDDRMLNLLKKVVLDRLEAKKE